MQAGGAIFNTNSFNATVNNPLTSGTTSDGGLTKNGLGTLTLLGSNNYNGGTTVNGGTLAITGSGTIGSGAATLIGGALDLGGKNITNLLLLHGGTLQNGTVTQASGSFDVQSGGETATGVLAGAAGLLKTTSGTAILNGVNTYTGVTNINGGVLGLGGVLGQNTLITFGGGTLKYIGNSVDYSTQIVNSTGAISIDTGNQSVEFNNSLASSNTGGLTVLSSSGGGVLVLDGSRATQVLLRLIPAPRCPLAMDSAAATPPLTAPVSWPTGLWSSKPPASRLRPFQSPGRAP